MKQGDIVIWQIKIDDGGSWFTGSVSVMRLMGILKRDIVCYWRIKRLKKPPTIQYTFDNPKGKIKLP